MIRFLLLFSLCACVSCSEEDEIFNRNHQFNNNGWLKDAPVRFKVNVKDAESDYRFFVKIKHDARYVYSNFIFSMTIFTPDGGERNTDFEVFLKDDNGRYTGKPENNNWEFSFIALKKTSFPNPGDYDVVFSHHMPFQAVMGLRQLGLSISKLNE